MGMARAAVAARFRAAGCEIAVPAAHLEYRQKSTKTRTQERVFVWERQSQAWTSICDVD
jgi:hypothetical protein